MKANRRGVFFCDGVMSVNNMLSGKIIEMQSLLARITAQCDWERNYLSR